MKRGAWWQPLVVVFAAAILSCGDDGGGGGGTSTTSAETTTSEEGSSSEESSSSGGGRPGEGEPYASCAGRWDCDTEPTCVEGDGDACEGGLSFAYGFCTDGCELSEECPAAGSGDAPPTCGSLPGVSDTALCFLDCTRNETCPDGMVCEEAAPSISVCTWAECE